jgi:hypothetical protein
MDSSMDNTPLLIIVLPILMLLGGGYYGRGRCGEAVVRKDDPSSPELAFVDALFPWAKPDSGRGFLGRRKWCSRCSGRGYTAKPNGWQACPDCYAGRLLVSDRDGDQPSSTRHRAWAVETSRMPI